MEQGWLRPQHRRLKLWLAQLAAALFLPISASPREEAVNHESARSNQQQQTTFKNQKSLLNL